MNAIKNPPAAAKADEIHAANASAAERARAALDFVQREVRCFGIEIGPGTHRPHAADPVMQQRFGDCKHKVMLLAHLCHFSDHLRAWTSVSPCPH